jgi:hypothetical protein
VTLNGESSVLQPLRTFKEVMRIITTKFSRLKRNLKEWQISLARLGRNGRKEDVINLMAWEIGDLRRAIAHAAANPKEVDPR